MSRVVLLGVEGLAAGDGAMDTNHTMMLPRRAPRGAGLTLGIDFEQRLSVFDRLAVLGQYGDDAA